MTRVAVVLALLLATACTAQRAGGLAASFDQAQEALNLGDTAGALKRTADALARVDASDDSEWAWRLRLLRAEALITRLELPDARALLEKVIPDTAGHASLRARQRYLDARIALASNDLQRNRVVVQSEFADDLPMITGDRIQPSRASNEEILCLSGELQRGGFHGSVPSPGLRAWVEKFDSAT